MSRIERNYCLISTSYLTKLLPSPVTVTDEGHRSDRKVLLFKNFLTSFNAIILFYIMPDYSHGSFTSYLPVLFDIFILLHI